MAVFDVGKHIVIDPEIVHGTLTFKGTRVPVDTVLTYVAKGESVEQIVCHWPQLSPEAVREAIRLASEALHQRYQVELLAAQDEARRLRDGKAVEVTGDVAGS